MRDDVIDKVESAILAKRDQGYDTALTLLEEAHILSQPYAVEHLYVHWKMFQLALEFKVWKEFFGQIPRLILAVPGSISGKAPAGNVGSTKMGIFEKKNT